MATTTFPTVDKCVSVGRERNTVVADMDGTLLRGRSSLPYFALIAFEVGGVLRLLFLLLTAPIAGLVYYFFSESAGIQVLIFATFDGRGLIRPGLLFGKCPERSRSFSRGWLSPLLLSMANFVRSGQFLLALTCSCSLSSIVT